MRYRKWGFHDNVTDFNYLNLAFASDKLVIARQPRAKWQISHSFFIFTFISLTYRLVKLKNLRKSENVCCIAIGTERQLVHIINYNWIITSELSFQIHFALNIPSLETLLVRRRQFFLRIAKHFFAFCDVNLVISSISFDNSMQWMNKMWI